MTLDHCEQGSGTAAGLGAVPYRKDDCSGGSHGEWFERSRARPVEDLGSVLVPTRRPFAPAREPLDEEPRTLAWVSQVPEEVHTTIAIRRHPQQITAGGRG